MTKDLLDIPFDSRHDLLVNILFFTASLEGKILPRIPLLLSLGMLLLACGCTRSEYCEEAGRPLTDAELIAKVISSEESYPNCCQIHRGNELEIEIYKKLRGTQKYPEYSYYEQHLIVNACGKVLSVYGQMAVKDRERPCWARKEEVSSLSNEALIHSALTKAAKEMKLDQSVQSIDKFMVDHPSCCRVQRDVNDEIYTKWLNPAQVEVYYTSELEPPNGVDGFFRILVAFNACADWAHMYGPSRINNHSVPEWVK